MSSQGPQPGGGKPRYYYPDDIASVRIGAWVPVIVATMAVGLRFLSKRLVRAPWHLDDYLVLLALIFHHGLFACSVVAVIRGGVGQEWSDLVTNSPETIVILLKSFWAGEIMYGLSNTTVKLSVVAFYHRIFPTREVKMGCYILGGMSVAWGFAVEVTTLVQCVPLQAFWDLEMQELPTTKCINPVMFFFANSATNTVLDFAILGLPLREIARLHTTRKKKVGIASVFLLGSMAFAASLVRTVLKGFMIGDGTLTNFTKQIAASGTATVIEVYVAIIGACLPTLVPIYRQLRYGNPLKSGGGGGGGRGGRGGERATGKPSSSSLKRNYFSGSAAYIYTYNSYCSATHCPAGDILDNSQDYHSRNSGREPKNPPPFSASSTIISCGAGPGSLDTDTDDTGGDDDLVMMGTAGTGMNHLPSDHVRAHPVGNGHGRLGAGGGKRRGARAGITRSGIMVGRRVEISTTIDPWYYDATHRRGSDKLGFDLPLQGIVVKKDLTWEEVDDHGDDDHHDDARFKA